MTTADIGRPALPRADVPQLSEGDWHKIAGVDGAKRITMFRDLVAVGGTVDHYSADISDQWATFRLLDGAIGAPSPEERARIRLATAIVDSRLRWMMFNYTQLRQALSRPKFRHRKALPDAARLVDSCGLLKDWR